MKTSNFHGISEPMYPIWVLKSCLSNLASKYWSKSMDIYKKKLVHFGQTFILSFERNSLFLDWIRRNILFGHTGHPAGASPKRLHAGYGYRITAAGGSEYNFIFLCRSWCLDKQITPVSHFQILWHSLLCYEVSYLVWNNFPPGCLGE